MASPSTRAPIVCADRRETLGAMLVYAGMISDDSEPSRCALRLRREGRRQPRAPGRNSPVNPYEQIRRRTSLSTKRRVHALEGVAHRARRLGRPREPLPAGTLDALIATNKHGAYCVPRAYQHRFVCQLLLQGRVWEERTLALISGEAPSADVVHAGTFVGDFLPALSRSRSEDAKVWAFEPSRENFRCAQITSLLNRLSNVELANAGLGSAHGNGLLLTRSKDGRPAGGQSRIIDPDGLRARAEAVGKEDVTLVAIDDVVPAERQVGVIQLDVEGYEREALLGATATIERCKPLIVLESPPETSWLERHLPGYRQVAMVNQNAVLRCS